MVEGMYHYLAKAWKNPDSAVVQDRLIKWRASEAVAKVDKPLRLDRARALGYKAKKGFVVFRVRVARGGRKRRVQGRKGRKSTKTHIRKTLKMNYKWVAEIRVAREYPTLEVLNSYYLGQDGHYYFFEVIMVDPNAPEIKNDPTINWICSRKNRGRAERGLTSAAKKSRGLRNRSPGLKVRPSLRAWHRQGK